ncbi:MAG: YidC/Oxa1 family membrane protein insertase [Chloroflexota bacterium]|nr:YidC/Oxa1 family membrane protein insertase [Chloroflexota bacterium]
MVPPGIPDLIATLPLAFSPPGWSHYVNFLEWSLDALAELFHSAGMAVIVFTIIVKTILVPLTVQSLRSSKAMQELQPKIKELQKKHGKDRQRLSQETMRLYSEHHINPMAGCLPMLIQIPIFFGLYRAIVNLSASETGFWTGGFLWIDSLDAADPWRVMPILAGAFQFVQTKMMRPANQGKITDPQQAMMNQMMNFMPLMVIVFGWGFAAGPVIYWATQSVFSVVQQWLITGWGSLRDWFPNLPEMAEHRRLGYRPPRNLDDVVVVSGDGAAPIRQGGAMGWIQRRMEEAERQASARQAARRGESDTTSSSDDDYQERVDAKSRGGTSTGNAARARASTRPVKKQANTKNPQTRYGMRVNNATEEASPSAPAPAKTEHQRTPDGKVLVPRKSRPSRKQSGD